MVTANIISRERSKRTYLFESGTSTPLSESFLSKQVGHIIGIAFIHVNWLNGILYF